MMKQGELLRIGELAKEAGVSLTTVKFYAKEGLIRPARKTGRNMAYYDRACVSTIATIRRLQRERYYPLSVIKRLMESAPVEQVELELLDAIHKSDAPDPGERVPLNEAARRSGLAKNLAGDRAATRSRSARQPARPDSERGGSVMPMNRPRYASPTSPCRISRIFIADIRLRLP
mgnify:CR=1 FL=1